VKALGGIIGLLLLLASAPAFAARLGTIENDATELHESAAVKSRVIDKLAKGTQLAVSNQTIEGFYKVRTSAGVVGFVVADSLILQANPSDAPPTPESVAMPAVPGGTPKATSSRESPNSFGERKHMRAKLLGGYNFFSVGDVNTLFGASVLQFGYSVGAEFDFVFTPALAMVIRVERLSKGVVARDLKSLETFNMELSSLPLMAGVEYTITSTPRLSTHATLLGGLALQTGLQSTDLNQLTPNVTEFSSSTFTVVLKADATYSFNKTWSAFAEAGYRYLKAPQTIPATSVNGSTIFKDAATQAFVPISLDLSGPFIGLGAGVSF
jgi:hypothetical protein